jgi:tetratricopeptide (TPR) repeat protein
MHNCSILKQERLSRGWSYDTVEVKTGIPQRSQENAENGYHFPRQRYIELYCKLYGKSAKELGLDKSDRIGVENTDAPTSQEEENPIMSDLIRRAVFSNLGSKLTGLIDLWPKHNYHYEELQSGISKAIVDYNAIVAHDSTYEYTRRQALKDMALVPVQLVGGIAIVDAGKIQKTDADILLKHCAAGIAACRYMHHRGKDLDFVSDLTSTYASLLQPLIYSKSEVHRKAAATLLAQDFRLKGFIASTLKNSREAIPYYHEAIRYGLLAENPTEQAIANRMMGFSYEEQGVQGYEQALSYAQTAYGLIRKDTPKLIRSFVASGLSLMSARNGHMDDAIHMLSEARDLFDPTTPISSVLYAESNLLAISAHISQHCGQWAEAVDLCEKSLSTPNISALGRIQRRIQYTKTEVSRDDQPRDMDLCITLLTEAIIGAHELNSKRFQHEAREIYDMFRIAWPREDAIKKLGKDHF